MDQKPTSVPETQTKAKKIWRDPVWASVIAGIILSLIGYTLTQVTDVFAGEEVAAICTATGPEVNVRNGPSLQNESVFQVSEGEYFHIIGNGDKDIVHGKTGRWKRISYGDKEGWIFSAYMRCK